MGQMLPVGQTVPSIGIRRADVAVGYTAYVVPISQQVLSKAVIYDPNFKGFIEVTQEEAMKSGRLNDVSTCYFMMVARLDCGMRGEIISDKFTVEYLRFTHTQYERFLLARQANPSAPAILLSKEKRVNNAGKDVSSLSMLPATLQLSPAITQRIEQLTAKPETLQNLWSMIDAATGVPYRQYEEWLKTKAGIGGNQLPGPDPQAGALPPMPTAYPGGGYPAAGGYPQAVPAAAPQPSVATPVAQAVPPQVSTAAPQTYTAAPQTHAAAPRAGVASPTAAPQQAAPAAQPFASASPFGGAPLSFEDDMSGGFDGEGGF